MLNSKGEIIYVGKALNLKNRVNQYFQKNISHPKTLALISKIHTIETMVTSTETEALLLESHLIKTYHPKFNILLRDDKSYPYIIIENKHKFPYIHIERGKNKPQKSLVFGPFPHARAVHEAINLIHKCFKLRNCRNSIFAMRTRPCLQYQIKRCSAPCTGLISERDYKNSVENAKLFLSGKASQLLDNLTKFMEQAVKELKFEEAAKYRDRIKQIRYIQASQTIIQDKEDLDILVISLSSPMPCIEHTMIRQGSIFNNQAYFPEMPTEILEESAQYQHVFEAFLRFYYFENGANIPGKILIEAPFSKHLITSYVEALKQYTNFPCKIIVKPMKNMQAWLDFAHNNLKFHQEQHMITVNFIQKRIKSLASLLNLSAINQLACFDVSHTQGKDTVASCVVFNQEGPIKSLYRQYNIVNTKPSDDYGALSEAILRHFKTLIVKQAVLPDVLLIDGGKGQVNIAAKALSTLKLFQIKLLGITKGEGRKREFDRIFANDSKKFLLLKQDDKVLHFLQYLRDEAHRFAISLHRKKRNKAQFHSTLMDIPGIGPKKYKRLIQHFGGLQGIKKASNQELCAVKGISESLAILLKNSAFS